MVFFVYVIFCLSSEPCYFLIWQNNYNKIFLPQTIYALCVDSLW